MFRKTISIFLFIFALILLPSSALAATPTNTWHTVIIPDMLTFKMPPSLEFPSGYSKLVGEELKKEIRMAPEYNSVISLQSKGINDFDVEAMMNAISINIINANMPPQSALSINKEIPFSERQLNEYYSQMRGQNETSLSNGYKILDWYPTKVIHINDKEALLTAFKASYKDIKTLYFKSYAFFNYDIVHTITVITPTGHPEIDKEMQLFLESIEFTDRSKL